MVVACVHIVDILGVAAAADNGLDAEWGVAAIADALEMGLWVRCIRVCLYVCMCTRVHACVCVSYLPGIASTCSRTHTSEIHGTKHSIYITYYCKEK